MENKCVLCGTIIPLERTVIVVGFDVEKDDYKVCCFSHQDTKELEEYMEKIND